MFHFDDLAGPLATRMAVLAATLAAAACGGANHGGMTTVPPPSVSLSVQPTTVSLGEQATLTWSSMGISSCTASGGWSGVQENSGTLIVMPLSVGSITYSLRCAGGAGGDGGAGATTATETLAVTAASAYSNTVLVTDSGVIDPWGLAIGSTAPIWVVNNDAGTAVVYDGNGVAQPHSVALIVSFPAGAANESFGPTGIVHNPSDTDFLVSSGARSAAATFIFAGESGKVGGWSTAVDPAAVVAMYTDPDGAVYKGLALAQRETINYLFATDFHNAKIDVFDSHFVRQPASADAFAFVDPTLPAGYAPFGIQAIDDGPGGSAQLYVSYAQQALPDRRHHSSGAGQGVVDVFDTRGTLIRHWVAAGGVLDAPWGIAKAPGDFGTLGGKVLVGNVGDGRINAFDPLSGRLIGAVSDSTGAAFSAPELRGVAFGNDAHNQPHNTLFYSAGSNSGTPGTLGRIDLGASAPTLGAPPVVALTAPAGPVHGVVALTATATDPLGISSVQFFVNGSTLGALTTMPYSIPWDTTSVADGPALLNVKATDPDGNVAVSSPVTVTVTVTVANGAGP